MPQRQSEDSSENTSKLPAADTANHRAKCHSPERPAPSECHKGRTWRAPQVKECVNCNVQMAELSRTKTSDSAGATRRRGYGWLLGGMIDGPGTHSGDADRSLIVADGFLREVDAPAG